jgi:hypothetical protein
MMRVGGDDVEPHACQTARQQPPAAPHDQGPAARRDDIEVPEDSRHVPQTYVLKCDGPDMPAVDGLG